MIHLINKKYAETPLESIERLRQSLNYDQSKMTYAGRLDPLATGLLIILSGEDVHRKEEFLQLDKVYEISLAFGFSTDTGDLLGLLTDIDFTKKPDFADIIKTIESIKEWTYPKFSSKTIDGHPLHSLVKKNREVKPPIRVMNFSITESNISTLPAQQLFKKQQESLQVKGDFRQSKIKENWLSRADEFNIQDIDILNLTILATSGTYMRSIPEIINKYFDLPSTIIAIHRTKVGHYHLDRSSI